MKSFASGFYILFGVCCEEKQSCWYNQSRSRSCIRHNWVVPWSNIVPTPAVYILITMLKISRMNLKIKRCGIVIFLTLFVVFLIHPGRFAVISVSSVTQDMLNTAILKYCDSEFRKWSTENENLQFLAQIQDEAATNDDKIGSDLMMPHYQCKSGGLCSPKTVDKNLPLVALIVPFKDRKSQLSIFLPYMHHFLQRQQINYTILVVDQLSQSKFNRAKLLNIGFKQILKMFPDCSCFIFHDVDLIPITDENLYICLDKPRHMISSLNEFRYNLPYPEMTGGALSISSSQFQQVNGFSNQFYGWGGEDDEFHRRLVDNNLLPVRLGRKSAKYVSLKHTKQSQKSTVDLDTIVPEQDGLKTLNFSIHSLQLYPHYSLVQVVL